MCCHLGAQFFDPGFDVSDGRLVAVSQHSQARNQYLPKRNDFSVDATTQRVAPLIVDDERAHVACSELAVLFERLQVKFGLCLLCLLLGCGLGLEQLNDVAESA